jgi:glycosyltransferase involved in cell wall biosynthesis
VRRALRQVREIARATPPSVIRCFASGMGAMAGFEARAATGAPVIVSVHTIPGDPAARPFTLRHRVGNALHAAMERGGVRDADITVAVYESLLPYLRAAGARRVEVAYNVLHDAAIGEKRDHDLHRPARLLSVGRQIPGKDPTPIIDAIATLPDVELLLVGDGPLHASLRARVEALGLGDRVHFERAVDNATLCGSFADHDVFVASNRYQGIPKAFMEPMLAGLPIVTDRADPPIPEIEQSGAVLTDGTATGYASALGALLADDDERARVGRSVQSYAAARFAPAAAERRYVQLYRDVIANGSAAARR